MKWFHSKETGETLPINIKVSSKFSEGVIRFKKIYRKEQLLLLLAATTLTQRLKTDTDEQTQSKTRMAGETPHMQRRRGD